MQFLFRAIRNMAGEKQGAGTFFRDRIQGHCFF